MKIWIDDEREAPIGYSWIHSVNEAIAFIMRCEHNQKLFEPYGSMWKIEVIDIDHDMSECTYDGIRLLDWLGENGYNYPIHIHSMDSAGVQNMRTVISRSELEEVQ